MVTFFHAAMHSLSILDAPGLVYVQETFRRFLGAPQTRGSAECGEIGVCVPQGREAVFQNTSWVPFPAYF
jgi:hypothetical protein